MKDIRPEDTARVLVRRSAEQWRQERDRASRILARVRAAVPAIAARCGAKRVFLFGSLAWGGVHARTDVDLAVEGVLPEQMAVFSAAFSAEVDVEVDLVPLERAPESLRRRVIRDGELIYPGTPGGA